MTNSSATLTWEEFYFWTWINTNHLTGYHIKSATSQLRNAADTIREEFIRGQLAKLRYSGCHINQVTNIILQTYSA